MSSGGVSTEDINPTHFQGSDSHAHTTFVSKSASHSHFHSCTRMAEVYSPKWTVYMHLCQFTSQMPFVLLKLGCVLVSQLEKSAFLVKVL